MTQTGRIGLLALVFCFAFSSFLTGCASTVQINSVPAGASVTVEGQYIGETPTSYTDTGIVFSKRNVVVEKEGYDTVRTTVSRDAQVNAGALIGGILCLWPLLLWAMDYPSNVDYELRPSGRVDQDFKWDEPQGEAISLY